MNPQLLQQASQLDVDEQIELVEAIWDGIVSRGAAPPITEAQKAELDRRLADHLANPDDPRQKRTSDLARQQLSLCPRHQVYVSWRTTPGLERQPNL